MHRVLLVDDVPNILSALRRCLHVGRNDDDAPEMVIECFTSATQALARLEEEDFDLIVSDYRMPEMDGTDFLIRTIESSPGATRILMTAYADLDAVLAAVNKSRVARIICKPWKDEDVRAAIFDALASQAQPNPGQRQAMDAKLAMQRRLHDECPELIEVAFDDDGGIALDLDFDSEH